jgi:hypothetical protein
LWTGRAQLPATPAARNTHRLVCGILCGTRGCERACEGLKRPLASSLRTVWQTLGPIGFLIFPGDVCTRRSKTRTAHYPSEPSACVGALLVRAIPRGISGLHVQEGGKKERSIGKYVTSLQAGGCRRSTAAGGVRGPHRGTGLPRVWPFGRPTHRQSFKF